jgi:hypothetical protein
MKQKFIPTHKAKIFMNIYLEIMINDNKVFYRYSGGNKIKETEINGNKFKIYDRAKESVFNIENFIKL